MKKHLLVIFGLLAIGFGARQVFLLAEDWRGRSQVAHAPTAEAGVVEAKSEEATSTQNAVAEAVAVQPQTTEADVAPSQSATPEVKETSTSEPQGNYLYYLLHPERKNRPENLVAEEDK